MRLSEHAETAIRQAMARVVDAANSAALANDLDAAKRHLNACWFAVHEATDTINTAEREARRGALAHIQGSAA